MLRWWSELERSGHEALAEKSLVSTTSTGAVEVRSTSSLWWEALLALGAVGAVVALMPKAEDDADKKIIESAVEIYREGRVEEAKAMLAERFVDRVNEKISRRISLKVDREKALEAFNDEVDDELERLSEAGAKISPRSFLARITTASTGKIAAAASSEKKAVSAEDALAKARTLVTDAMRLEAEAGRVTGAQSAAMKLDAARKREEAESLLAKEVYAPLVKKAKFAIIKSGVGEGLAEGIAAEAVSETVLRGAIRKDLPTLLSLDSKEIVKKLYGNVRTAIAKQRRVSETMAMVRGNESDEAILSRLGYDQREGKTIVDPKLYEEYLKELNAEVNPETDNAYRRGQREAKAQKLATRTFFPRTNLGVRYVRGPDYDKKFSSLVASGVSVTEASRRALDRVELEKESVLEAGGMNSAVYIAGTNTPFVDPTTGQPDSIFVPRTKVRQARVLGGEDVFASSESEDASGFGEMGETAASAVTPTTSRLASPEAAVALSSVSRAVAGARQKMPRLDDPDEAKIGEEITDVDLVETIFNEARTVTTGKGDAALYRKIKEEQGANIAKRVFGEYPTPEQLKKTMKVFNAALKRAEELLLTERVEGRPVVDEYLVFPKVLVKMKSGAQFTMERSTGATRLYPLRTQEAIIRRLDELNDEAERLEEEGRIEEALKMNERAQMMVDSNKQWLGGGFVQREANRIARKRIQSREKESQVSLPTRVQPPSVSTVLEEEKRREYMQIADEFLSGRRPYSSDPVIAESELKWAESWRRVREEEEMSPEQRRVAVRAKNIRVARALMEGRRPFSANPKVAARERSWAQFWASQTV